MTDYTGYGTGTPSGIAQDSDAAPLNLSTRFHVNTTGLSLKKIRFYLPSGAGSPPSTGYYGYLWASASGAASGVPLAVVDFGTISLDAWNEAELDTYYPLTSGTDYYVGVYFDAFIYGFVSGEFSSEVDASPIIFPADSGTTFNGAFVYGVNGATPGSTFGSSWYGVDVTVTDGATPDGAKLVSVSQIAAASGTSVTANLPPVFAADDLLMLHVVSKATSATIANITGWTGLTQVDNGTTLHERIFYKIASGSDSAPSVTQDASQLIAVTSSAWRGVDTSTPLDATPTTNTGNSTTMTCPTITTVTDGAKIVRLTASGDDNYHQSPSEGQLAYGADAYNTTVGSDGSLGMSHFDQSSHGSTGTATITQGGNGADVYVGHTIALRPASTATAYPRTTSDSVSLSDSATRTVVESRTASDSVALSDSAARSAMALTRTTSDTVTLSDSSSSSGAHPRSAADSVTLTDAATRGVQTLTRTTSDSVSLGDAATRTQAFVRTAADSVTLSDSMSSVTVVPRSVSDSVTLADAASRSSMTLVRATTDSVTLTDSATGSVVSPRATADSITLADSASRSAQSLSRTASDSITLADVAVVGASYETSDGITLSDSASGNVTSPRTTSDMVTLADAATGSAVLPRTASDSVTLADVPASLSTLPRTASDSLSLSDSAGRTGQTLTRTTADSITLTDAASYEAAYTTSDSITLADSASRAGATLSRTTSDALVLSDAVVSALSAPRAASDAITLIDSAVVGSPSYVRATSDSITLVDSGVVGTLTRIRTASDSITLTDSAVAIYRILSHGLVVSDPSARFVTDDPDARFTATDITSHGFTGG